jgi:hypothetical protein
MIPPTTPRDTLHTTSYATTKPRNVDFVDLTHLPNSNPIHVTTWVHLVAWITLMYGFPHSNVIIKEPNNEVEDVFDNYHHGNQYEHHCVAIVKRLGDLIEEKFINILVYKAKAKRGVKGFTKPSMFPNHKLYYFNHTCL